MVKTNKQENLPIQTSFMLVDGNIIEQCYDGKGSYFAIWDGKTVEYKKFIDVDGVTYEPIVAQEVVKKAIMLPTKAEDYGTDEQLDTEIKDFITKWLDIPTNVMQFALWNIKRSWVYERFHTLNYLRALGDTGMGKSRFLDTLGSIHYKPIATSGATTSAPIFRIIQKWKGTLIMDEADFSKSDEAQDIIKIINMGYEKGKWVMRCDKDEHNAIDFFDPYCPKILATRKTFTDNAVESRCITQVMRGTNKKVPYNLDASFFEDAQKLRNKLLMWRFNNYFSIDNSNYIDLGLNLEPRVMQIVNTFVSMFGNDKKQLEVFKTFIQQHQEELIDGRRSSFAGSIVEAIYNLLKNGNTDISAQDIINEGGLTDYKGNVLKPRGLSSQLRSLGFGKMVIKKVNGVTKRCVPLELEVIQNLCKRYGFDSYGVTVVTINRGTPENQQELTTKSEGSNHNNRNNSNLVTNVPLELKVEETAQKPKKPMVFKLTNAKDTLYTMLSNKEVTPIEDVLKIFPKEFAVSIEVMIDNLKKEGEIFEVKPGFIKLL